MLRCRTELPQWPTVQHLRFTLTAFAGPGLHFAPLVFISALEEFNLQGAIKVAFDLREERRRGLPTD